VAEEDKGVVIGRRGRTINSIRDLITINAIRNDKRVKVLIKDDNRGHHEESSTDHVEDTDGMLVDEEL
jgi:ribosomal protein S3